MGCVSCTVVAGFGPALTTSLLKMLLALHEWLIARRILIPCLRCWVVPKGTREQHMRSPFEYLESINLLILIAGPSSTVAASFPLHRKA
jgi:hypothetical protein